MIFDYIWSLVLDGKICQESYHKLLGSWFGYPECCTDFYVKNFDKPDLTYICIKECEKLGEYVQCHECWEKENLNNERV